jgi:ATP-binding cassette subfamily B protein
MGASRLRRTLAYLRPHRRDVAIGAAALVVVNLLGVSLPLLVRRVVDGLHSGFAVNDLLRGAALIITLATVMGLVRL